eukprot:sb/3467997/
MRTISQRSGRTPKPQSVSRVGTERATSEKPKGRASTEKNIPERPKGKFPTIESDGEGHVEEPETGNNKVRESEIYKVRYNGITMHLPAYRVVLDTETDSYRVNMGDKIVPIKRKDVTLVTTSSNNVSLDSVASVRNDTTDEYASMRRSPFQSPVSWDKRLRCSSKKGTVRAGNRPRWQGTNRVVANKSKRLLFQKMMVPSKVEKGKYHLYGSPGTDTDPGISLTDFVTDNKSRVSEEREIDGRTSASASEIYRTETAVETDTAYTPTEKPYISHER